MTKLETILQLVKILIMLTALIYGIYIYGVLTKLL